MTKRIWALTLMIVFTTAASMGCSASPAETTAPATTRPSATSVRPSTNPATDPPTSPATDAPSTAANTALPSITPPINPSYTPFNDKMAPKTLPEFSTTGLDGETYTRDILQGNKLTMVYYWATYCPYCKEEMPYMSEIGKSMPEGSRMVSVVMDIHGDEPEETAIAQQLVTEHNITFPLLKMDEAGVLEAHAFDETTGKPFIKPTTVFYDEDGNQVGDVLIGTYSKEEYVQALEERLSTL